jgi:hypothetical protein
VFYGYFLESRPSEPFAETALWSQDLPLHSDDFAVDVVSSLGGVLDSAGREFVAVVVFNAGAPVTIETVVAPDPMHDSRSKTLCV